MSNLDLEERLRTAFPQLMPEDSMRGIECASGWERILTEACKRVAALNAEGVYIWLAKEKFAELCLHFSSYPEDVQKKLLEIEEWAAAESRKTCEFCGQPGKARGGSYWMKTRCDACQAAHEARQLDHKS